MQFTQFSKKQLLALTWWLPGSRHEACEAVICDGAVRSGKTFCLSLSFVLWAMYRFSGQDFAFCGKTATSLRRNLLTPLLSALPAAGFTCGYHAGSGVLTVRMGGCANRFHLFGGQDEGSAALIQGVTLAGVLLDEVALMPRSFVEQALARCSVPGSRFFFSCNPEHPGHWFHQEWILKRAQRRCLYLHFQMQDNPSLHPDILERYQRLYTGVFHRRFVLGEWTLAHGAVYPQFDRQRHVFTQPPAHCTRYAISCDYGTVNPASFGLWGYQGGVWHRLREYYHDSRAQGVQHTDEEYAHALLALAGGLPLEAVVVDPSAASFIRCLRQRGLPVIGAGNHLLDGIRRVSGLLQSGGLLFHESCADTLREFALYRWDHTKDTDTPRKEHDHAMDDIRYFAAWAAGDQSPGFAAAAVTRAPAGTAPRESTENRTPGPATDSRPPASTEPSAPDSAAAAARRTEPISHCRARPTPDCRAEPMPNCRAGGSSHPPAREPSGRRAEPARPQPPASPQRTDPFHAPGPPAPNGPELLRRIASGEPYHSLFPDTG